MTQPQPSDLETLGFKRAGTFKGGRFELAPAWRGKQVVYLWTRGAGAEEILRVGIACGPRGFGARYASYNRWLAGRHKPEDAAEQYKAGLFRRKLDEQVTIWAVEIESKERALQLETSLRTRFGPALELDLMTEGWAKQEMRRWRGADSAGNTRSTRTKRRDSSAPSEPPSVAPALKAMFNDLDAALRERGLTPSPVRDGWTYKLGGRSICRVDPKPSKGCLRVEVGLEAEAAAPPPLREVNLVQRGWLTLWPEHSALGVAYVLSVVDQRLRR